MSVTLRGYVPDTKVYELRTLSGDLIESKTTVAQEQIMTNNPASFAWKVTQLSTGKFTTGTYDSVTAEIARTVWIGHNVPNGNYINHIDAINDAASNPAKNSVGCLFRLGDSGMATAANWNDPKWNEPFNPATDTPYFEYDHVVKRAYETGVSIRPMLDFARTRARLSDNAGYEFAWGPADQMMRADGVTPVVNNNSNPNGDCIGSVASTVFQDYCVALTKKVITRWLPSLNSGTIAGFSFKLCETAESHFEFIYYLNGGFDFGTPTFADGDYHPNMVSGFRAFAQAHYSTIGYFNSSLNADRASFNDITGSWLSSNSSNVVFWRQKWMWYRNERLKKFYDTILNRASTEVAGLTRTKWGVLDMGSLLDSLPRGAQNLHRLMENQYWIGIKSNEGTNYPPAFTVELLRSTAYRIGGFAMVEPTGPNNSFGATGSEAYNQGVEFINQAKARGVGVSFIPQPHQVVDIINATSLSSYTTPLRQQAANGNSVYRFYINLSYIYEQGQAYGIIKDEWAEYTDRPHADILIVDNWNDGRDLI